MQNFLASARKYRPQLFNDVVGQESIVMTLKNAIAKQHLGQALLFTGPRGVGKTTCARIVAKELNPEIPEENIIYNVIEIDAASHNSVDNIREMIESVKIPPISGTKKVYIIDEAHMLSQAAFNAFLKTLEEPPAHAIFILATTEKHKILPTVLSRCQVYDFKRISVADIIAHLKNIAQEENVQYEEEALHLIAQNSDGAMRDSLSIFDKLCNFCDNNLTTQEVAHNLGVPSFNEFHSLVQTVRQLDKQGLISTFNRQVSKGFELSYILSGMSNHFKLLLLIQNQDEQSLEIDLPQDNLALLREESEQWTEGELYDSLELLQEIEFKHKTLAQPKLGVEIHLLLLIKLKIGLKKKEQS